MKNQEEKNAGLALLVGSLMMIVTMGLHPTGGSFEHLLKITPLIIGTHSIAIAAVPFIAFGFWGLTKRLTDGSGLSILALIVMSFGLVAVMCAAALNGLTLPLFINNYQNATPEVIESIKLMLHYNSALNHAFDFIFIGAACVAIPLWSVAIIKTKALPQWVAYFGILFSLGTIILASTGFGLVDLHGFQVFIFSLVAWVITIGVLLFNSTTKS